MRLFNLDSPVMVFLTKVANLMILNILTILLCIPLVPAGSAITALYYVTIKMARGDDPYIVKSYFKSFKENFRQATIIWLIMLAVILLIAVDWQVVFDLMEGTGAKVMRVIIFVISAFLVLTGLYVFPVLSRFENTIKHTIKNAFLMSLLNLPKSILIVILHFLPLVAVLITVQALPVVFLLGFSTVAYLCSMLFVRIFKRYEPEEEDTGNGDELAPLSFIVEEQKEKERALAAQAAAQAAQEPGTGAEDALEARFSASEEENGAEKR